MTQNRLIDSLDVSFDLAEFDAEGEKLKSERVANFCADTYANIKDFSVALDSDPSTVGISSLNEKLATAREYANSATAYRIKAIRLVASLQESHQILSDTIDDIVTAIKISDDDCKKARSMEEKRMIAESRIPNYIKTRRESLRRLDEAKTCLKVVGLVCDLLTNTKDDILSQLGVIKQQLLVGELSLKIDEQTAKLLISASKAKVDSSVSSLQEGTISI